MRLILLTAVSLTLMSNMALAQTWQEWVKTNPTYRSKEQPKPPAPASAPAPAPATPTPSPNAPMSASDSSPVASTKNPLFESFFMQQCTSRAPQAYCACMLEQVQNNYSIQDIHSLSTKMKQSGELPPEFVNMAYSCMSKVQ